MSMKWKRSLHPAFADPSVKKILALLLLSFMALLVVFSCGQSGSAFVHFDASSYSCQEHVISSLLDPHQTFDTTMLFVSRIGILPVVVVAFLFFASGSFAVKVSATILNRIRYLSWIWAKTLPFKSQRGFLPHFVAQRDA